MAQIEFFVKKGKGITVAWLRLPDRTWKRYESSGKNALERQMEIFEQYEEDCGEG